MLDFLHVKTRLFEVFVLLLIPSVIASLILSKFRGDTLYFGGATVFSLLYLFWTCYCLIEYRISVPKKRNYYKVNFSIYGILCAIAVGLPALLHFTNGAVNSVLEKIYYYCFLNFNLFFMFGQTANLAIGRTVSAIIMTVIIFIIVSVIPLFIDKEEIIKKRISQGKIR